MVNLELNTITLSGVVHRRDDKYKKSGDMYVSIVLRQDMVEYGEDMHIVSRVPQFFRCTIFGNKAKSAMAGIMEGSRIVVHGDITMVKLDDGAIFPIVNVDTFKNYGIVE